MSEFVRYTHAGRSTDVMAVKAAFPVSEAGRKVHVNRQTRADQLRASSYRGTADRVFYGGWMTGIQQFGVFPGDNADETELFLGWLDFLRGAVVRKIDGVTDKDARCRPEGRLLPLLGVVNHLTHVEWRWIDGGFLGVEVSRSEEEFFPGDELSVDSAVEAYRSRAASTNATVRSLPLDTPCRRKEGATLRWVLVHLINETARHAGHADSVRELLDGTTGE